MKHLPTYLLNGAPGGGCAQELESRGMMAYIVSWVFQAIIICVLVLWARSKKVKCGWTYEFAKRRLVWGISIVVLVQIGQFIRESEGHGLGLLYHIQWVGVYWIALATFRLKDLKKEAAKNVAVVSDRS